MALTAAEKQRRYRERRKLNKDKDEEYKQKHRERYHKTKRLKCDMSTRELRLNRRKWRTNKAKQREEKKNVNSLLLSPDEMKNNQSNSGRKKVKCNRTKLYKDNINLKIENKKLKQKLEKLRKQAYRKRISSKTEDINLSPCSKTRQFMKKNFPGVKTPEIQKVSRQLLKYNSLTHSMSTQFKNLQDRKERFFFKNIVSNKVIKKYRIMREIGFEALGLKQRIRRFIQKKKHSPRNRSIRNFYLRDDVSRATAGKKETITKYSDKKQRRYLLDTMKNLHKKFLEEGGKCSYTSFAANRPFYVLAPSIGSRNTCLCKLHSNVKFKISALKKMKIIQTDHVNSLIEMTVCDIDSKDCMYKQCESCLKKCIPMNIANFNTLAEWNEWIYQNESYEKNMEKIITKKISKEKMNAPVAVLVKKFQEEFDSFKKHVYNIRKQYEAYRCCIDNLQNNEAAIHIDFSQNYNLKLAEEIQAKHYGASQNQITLHTGVLYYGAPKQVTSFCTVSSCNKHNPSAIWAHLSPIIKMIKEDKPDIDTLHFFSDGPSTQYKQKNNFYLFSHRIFKYAFRRATWSFFESGHGKGAADGIGGTLKRIADRVVSCGSDISDVHQFIHFMRKSSKIKLFCITEEEIEAISKTLPGKIPVLKGTRNLHQLIAEREGHLRYRDLSCFCGKESRGFCICYGTRHYQTKKLPKKENNSGLPLQDKLYQNPKKIKLKVSEVYSSSDDSTEFTDEDLNVCEEHTHELTAKNIRAGTYLLIQIRGGKKKLSSYKYVGIAQSEIEEDGEIKVMFLRSTDDSGRIFQVNETDVSYINFEQVMRILKTPSIKMKGNRLFYQFDVPVGIYEK